MAHSYNYKKLWIDPASLPDRRGAYAYWERAVRFERAALREGRSADAAFQRSIRIERENQMLEMDATEGGNI